MYEQSDAAIETVYLSILAIFQNLTRICHSFLAHYVSHIDCRHLETEANKNILNKTQCFESWHAPEKCGHAIA
jgi:hypothetical protein